MLSYFTLVPFMFCVTVALVLLISMRFFYFQRMLHVFAAVLYVVLIVLVSVSVYQEGVKQYQFGGYPIGIAISFYIDAFSALMLLVTSVVLLTTAIYSLADRTIKTHTSFYPAFWFLALSITGLFSTRDVFNLYIWFELMVVSSMVLMMHSKEKGKPMSYIHYFGVNLLATLILLLSIGLIYGISDSLDMQQISWWLNAHKENTVAIVALGFMMVAFAIKSALFPFYFWLPDAYSQTSVSAGGLFAGLLTKVGVYALIRSAFLFFSSPSWLYDVLLVISSFTMIFGVFGAMSAFNIRRILSFHIVSQVGYMTYGLAIGTKAAITAALFYIVHHIFVKTNLFLISGVISRFHSQTDIRNMGGLFRLQPVLSVMFFIAAFSLAGIPPLSGFWAKYLILSSAMDAQYWFSAFLAFLVGFYTLFSMIKIWQYAFITPEQVEINRLYPKERITLYTAIFILTALTLIISVFPETLFDLVQKASNSLIYD